MAAHDPHSAPPREESLAGLLAGFFPGAGEAKAFVVGLAVGAGILAVLAAIGVLNNGHIGIWPTF